MNIINVSLNSHGIDFDCEITPIESDKLEPIFNIKCNKDNYNKLTDRIASAKYASKTLLKGFRPGKVPLSMVKTHNLHELTNDAILSVVNSAMDHLVKTNNYEIMGESKIEDVKVSDEEGFSSKLIVFLAPEVSLPDFTKMKFEENEYDFQENEIEEAINNLAENSGDFEDVRKGSTAKEGNLLKIDFVGSVDGKEFEGGSAKDATLIIGSNRFIPGFEEQLKGAKEGDKITVKVRFPENYHVQDLAGKDSEFAVDVHKIQKRATVEINDEFAKKLGVKDLEELKNVIKNNLISSYKNLLDQINKRNLLDELDKIFDCEVPKTAFEKEKSFIEEQYKKENNKISDKNLKDLAHRRVKLGIMLAKAAKNFNIEATEEDFKKAILSKAMEFKGQEKEVIDYFVKNQSAVESLRGGIVEDKTIKHIASIASKTSKKMTADKIKKAIEEIKE